MLLGEGTTTKNHRTSSPPPPPFSCKPVPPPYSQATYPSPVSVTPSSPNLPRATACTPSHSTPVFMTSSSYRRVRLYTVDGHSNAHLQTLHIIDLPQSTRCSVRMARTCTFAGWRCRLWVIYTNCEFPCGCATSAGGSNDGADFSSAEPRKRQSNATRHR
ncbi:hypothetical protein EXIGLDRAFT_26470 [Exidia glandulosa HHB12029]|uniref:Uncharacterized protein n=1 Tax=Exidia glandulosa HHB12029 TaxID=1314781 RepID=A0A165R3Y1_EXIGL|nr:hypothetical protein EXIGLDRAFT_26470 [Exidia glandulosa HHB12029]